MPIFQFQAWGGRESKNKKKQEKQQLSIRKYKFIITHTIYVYTYRCVDMSKVNVVAAAYLILAASIS